MIRRVLVAAAALATLTCAYTWPLVGQVGSAIPHDRGDPLLVTWILWWSSHTMPLTAAWWNAPAFYPSSGVLAFSENLLGLAPITAPVIALTGSALAGYNVAFLLSYLLNGLAAYMLAFVLTRRHDASFVSAVAFAFAPYRLSHTQHLQVLSSYWMPVAIAALHQYLTAPRWRWAALFAVSWLLQALACGYYLFFLTIFVLLWLAWFAPRRLTWRDGARLGVAWSVAGLAISPILLGYRSIHAAYGFTRSPVEVLNYSADLSGLWSTAPDSLMWSWFHGGAGSESEQFPGLTILLLFAAGAFVALRSFRLKAETTGEKREAVGAPGPSVASASGLRASVVSVISPSDPVVCAFRRNRRELLFYSLTAVLMWILSLGPRPTLHGTPLGVYGPYALLMNLPGFNGMRVPARLWMLSILCLAVVAAVVISRIESRRLRRLVVCAATVGLLLDGWPRAFPIMAVPAMRITTTSARARLGLPLRENETETMYGAIAQARPVFNGYSGYYAPQHFAMRYLLEHYDPRILDRLAASEPIEVVIEHARDGGGEWDRYVQARQGARRVDVSPEWTSYELPATGAVAPGAITGPALRVTSVEASVNSRDIGAILDGDLATRWHAPSQTGGETIVADLETARPVAAVVLCLGAYAGQYPRGLAVEVSADGIEWSTVYTGGTALETYDAALRSPREVPVTLPVHRDRVRFVRLRQTGSDPNYGWTIVEMRVIG